MQEPLSVQMRRGDIKVAVDRPAHPAVHGTLVSTPEEELRVPPLRLGQIVTARVIELLPGGRYLMTIDGTSLEASGPAGLVAGAELVLRVDQLQPTISLHMLSSGLNDGFDLRHLLRTRLPNFTAAGEVLGMMQRELGRLIEQLPVAEILPRTAKLYAFLSELVPVGDVPNAEQLAAYLRHGGHLYEAKLWQQAATNSAAMTTVAEQDVKGLLLGALQELAMAPESSTTAELVSAGSRYLDHIESQQGLRLLAQLHEQPSALQIPVWLGQAFATILLTVDRDSPRQRDGQSGDDSGYHTLFLLDLDGLGQTRIETWATTHGLRVKFYIEQPGALCVLQQELPMLQRALQRTGYPEVLIDARPLTDLSAGKRLREDTCAVAVPLGVNLVDVKV